MRMPCNRSRHRSRSHSHLPTQKQSGQSTDHLMSSTSIKVKSMARVYIQFDVFLRVFRLEKRPLFVEQKK